MRLASGETRVVSLPRTATCAKGDRLRIIETPFLTGARFDAAPEACGRKPGSGGAST